MFGSHTMLDQTGNLIPTEDGLGQTKAGFGFLMNHGAGQLIITEDGFMMTIRAGYGYPEPHGPPLG